MIKDYILQPEITVETVTYKKAPIVFTFSDGSTSTLMVEYKEVNGHKTLTKFSYCGYSSGIDEVANDFLYASSMNYPVSEELSDYVDNVITEFLKNNGIEENDD